MKPSNRFRPSANYCLIISVPFMVLGFEFGY